MAVLITQTGQPHSHMQVHAAICVLRDTCSFKTLYSFYESSSYTKSRGTHPSASPRIEWFFFYIQSQI